MYHMLMLFVTCMFINTWKWWKSVTEVPSTLIPALFHEYPPLTWSLKGLKSNEKMYPNIFLQQEHYTVTIQLEANPNSTIIQARHGPASGFNE